MQKTTRDSRVRDLIDPARILWQSHPAGGEAVEEAARLLAPASAQSTVWGPPGCFLRHKDSEPGVLLDFGRELHGGVQIIVGDTPGNAPVRARVRFGESASEAMGKPDQQHAIHDTVIDLPWMGTAEFGNTGFRFVRIDLPDPGSWVEIKSVRAVFLYRDSEYKGAFTCSDDRLNAIWQTGAYTVHLNMQEHVWDGIKRDRLVWLGDLHPETMVISTVFGADPVVPQSLDFARDETPLPKYINGMSSYSLWWIIIHHDWFWYHGDRAYLEQQRVYLVGLLHQMAAFTGDTLPNGFLDWPTSPNKKAVHAGLHGLLVRAFRAGLYLCDVLGENETRALCAKTIDALCASPLHHENVKTAAAMMVIAGMLPADATNRDVFTPDPNRGISTFYGYYVLQARAMAGDIPGCLGVIRDYWGTMLDFGATSFWEDFNLDWTRNASRIDELPVPGKDDLHADFGDYCYKGLRHSLCHGWAGGPTAWLTEHVLGLRPLEPGCTRLALNPNLGGLEWARGAFPTPLGTVTVEHTQTPAGIETKVDAPKGIEIVRG